MNIRDRLMSRASVGVMAAFAPKPEAGDTSKVGQPEKVEDAAPSDGGGDELGLSAEEQAQFNEMRGSPGSIAEAPDKTPAEPAAEAGEDGDGDDVEGEGDAEIEAGAVADAPDGTTPPADGERAPRQPKTISYGRHRKDVDKLQKQLDAATAETAKEREQRLRLDERTTMLLQAIQTKPAAPAEDPAKVAAAAAAADPEPDKEADPIGHLQWQNRGLAKRVEDLTSGRQQEQRLTAEQQEEAAIYRAYEGDILREAQADPTFQDAFAYLRETRYRELGHIFTQNYVDGGIDVNDPVQCDILGPPGCPERIELERRIMQSFHNEQMLVARNAMQAKRSPAKTVASLARARGFVPRVAGAAPAAGDTPPKQANGAAPPARQVAPAAPGSVKDQLEAIREGQDASRSLSDAGGSPGGAVTPERIANMTDEEFMDFYDKMPKNQFDRQVLGKPAPS